MIDLIKPYFGPSAMFALERGLDAANVTVTPFQSGLLLAFAAFWLFFVIVSHKALIERFPGLRVWLPFVDPAGAARTPAKELTGRFISGQTFDIADVAHNNKIIRRTFDDCDIYGPAVLFLSGVSHLQECTFSGNRDGVFIETPQSQIIGPISAVDCGFRNCRFHGVGFIGNAEYVARLRAGTRP